ncbi:hypothetical protein D3C83_56270 [compost metagenome]
MPASEPSSAYTTRVKATGRLFFLKKSSRPVVRLMAGSMLPPPKSAGSLKPTVKSTTSSALLRPKPMRLPKFCSR